MDAATQAGWDSGFGAILKAAEKVEHARAEQAAERRWAQAWIWWDDDGDDERPVEREAFERIFWQCKNARKVSRIMQDWQHERYQESFQGVDWDWVERLAHYGLAQPKWVQVPKPVQLPLPFFDMSPTSISKGRLSTPPARVVAASAGVAL